MIVIKALIVLTHQINKFGEVIQLMNKKEYFISFFFYKSETYKTFLNTKVCIQSCGPERL